MLRKLASKLLFSHMKAFNEDYFSQFQYAMKSAGMETIIHHLNCMGSIHPEWDRVSLDGRNSFNEANNLIGLSETAQLFPMAFPLLKAMYLHNSTQFLRYQNEFNMILCSKGFHQGDVLGTWSYIMTLQPLLLALAEHISDMFPDFNPMVMILFYVDDGYLCGPHEIVVEAIRFLRQHGPNYGYHIRSDKGAYMLGKCDSKIEATRRFAAITDPDQGVGFNPDIVKIHPDDLEMEHQSQAAAIPLPDKYYEENLSSVEQRRADYGTKLLGSFMGTNEFVQSKFDGIIESWTNTANKLIAFPLFQHRMLLFRYCFNSKPIHLLRTVSNNLTMRLVEAFMHLQKRILESMFGTQLPHPMMKWVSLPFEKGGLGLLDMGDVHHVAHCASVFGLKRFRDGYLAAVGDNMNLGGAFIQELRRELVDLRLYLGLDINATDNLLLRKLDGINKEAKHSDSTFQNALYLLGSAAREAELELAFNNNKHKLYHFHLMKNDSAAKWLQTVPRYANTRIDNDTYSIGLCFRYFLDVPQIVKLPEGDLCPFCFKKKYKVDKTGHHMVTGCSKSVNRGDEGQRNSHHKHVRMQLFRLFKHAMLYTAEEPSLANFGSNKRPDLVVHIVKDMVTYIYYIDLTIVDEFDGSSRGELKLPVHDPKDVDNKANKAANEKINLYRPVFDAHPVAARNIEIIPFVMYSNGKLHETAIEFLKKVAAHGEERRRVPQSTLLKYYMKMISISNVQRVSHSIKTKAAAIASGNYQLNRTFRNESDSAMLIGTSRVSFRRARH